MNFAVMRSMFGDFWVGKTRLEPNGVGVFASWDEAVGKAMDLAAFVEENLTELQEALEEEVEEISPEMEKWIVR